MDSMEEIIIRHGLLNSVGTLARERFGAGKAALISDSHVYPLYGKRLQQGLKEAGYEVFSHVAPAGEASKSLQRYGELLDFLAGHGLTRSDVVFALGGGVVGDLAGFAAASYLRGIKLVQLPTTLLACVDSAIGGKCAIDLKQGKNLAGAFYPAHLVLMDPDTLRSLPEAEYRNGLAEVVKTAVIRDEQLFYQIPYDVSEELDIIKRCVAIKLDVVSQDEKDTGIRQLLNFGHSFGHAMEALSHYQTSHGQAVAMGMALMARASARMGLCPPGDAGRLVSMLRLLGLQTESSYDEDQLFAAMMMDKKRSGDQIGLILMHGIGDCRLHRMSLSAARDVLRQGCQA